MKKVKIRSLKSKIILVFCAFVILPLLMINIVVFKRYEHSLKESTIRAYDMVSSQIESNIDTYLKVIARISLSPYYNSDIQKIVYNNSVKGYSVSREDNQTMNDFLFQLIIQDNYLRSIFITDMEGNVIYDKSNGGYYRQTEFFQPYIKEMTEEHGLIPLHSQTYVNRSRLTVFSYIRVLKEVRTNMPIGYIILEIDSSVIFDMIERLSDISNEYVAVFLGDGAILGSNIPEEEFLPFQEVFHKLSEASAGKAVPINGKGYLLSFSGDSENDVYTVIYQDERQAMEELNHLSVSTLVMIGVISCLVLLGAVVSAGRLTKPLVRLRNAMAVVRTGKFDVEVQMPDSSDEVYELTRDFNSMLQSIDGLIKREYKLNLQEREAELKALQNQINPHFLYNTLESITMLAEIHDDTDVADMVTSLGEFLRFTITTGDSLVPLEKELLCVENYIEIQNIRYNHRIRLNMECPEVLGHHKIVKMSVQPIVENILLHGYKGLTGEILIDITAYREGKYLCVRVSDQGEGMDDKVLKTVRDNLEMDEELYSTKQSIGLRNVHQRLRLMYGSECGLEFVSRIGEGTTVVIQVPGEEEETDAAYHAGRR